MNTTCGNCGEVFDLEEAFTWLDGMTSRVICPSCGSQTLQRVSDLDEDGRPAGGEFHVVRTYIRKDGIPNGKRTPKHD